MSKHRHWTFTINTPAEMFTGRKGPEYAGRPGPARLKRGKTGPGLSDLNLAPTGARGANETAGSLANIVSDLKDAGNTSGERAGRSNDRASAADGDTSRKR